MLSFEHSSPPTSLLLIEEDEHTAATVVETVSRHFPSLTVHRAASAELGVELLREHRPDVIITAADAGAGGIGISRQILFPAPGTPIILVSDTGPPRRPDAAGVSHHLTRPLDTAALAEAVSRCLAVLDQERLRQEELRLLSRVVRQSSKAVAIADIEGRVVYVNDTFAELTGYPAEEILGRKVQETHSASRSFTKAWETVSSGKEWYGECLSRRKDGKTYWASLQAAPLFGDDGRISHFVTVRADVTSRRKQQEELERVQRLESLGVVAGGIAHDFNNILTGILGNISFAQALASDNAELAASLHEAEKASQRAAELARKLLTFARGGKPLKQRVGVRQLVDEALCLSLAGSTVQGEVRIPEEIDALEVDPAQIQQAFRNILVNAVQAMPGGQVVVSAENVALPQENPLELAAGSYVKISFADQGCGIPEQELQRVFDPYFSTKPGASGIGLTSVHSIVTRHGGHIAVESLPGGGTTFICYLPSTGKVPPPAARQHEETPRDDGAGGTVLLMDDESVVRKVTSKMLECLGYRVTTCSNGGDAIELYREARRAGNPYRAVIMDLTIVGGMGGKEAAQHILALDPEARLVVSSGYFDDPVLADYRDYGFCAVLPKPYKSADLAELLGRVHKGAPADEN